MDRQLQLILGLPSEMCTQEKINLLLTSPCGNDIKRLLDNLIKSHEFGAVNAAGNVAKKYDCIPHKVAVPARKITKTEMERQLRDEITAVAFCKAVQRETDTAQYSISRSVLHAETLEREKAANLLARPCQFQLTKKVASLHNSTGDAVKYVVDQFSNGFSWIVDAQRILETKSGAPRDENAMDGLKSVIQERENKRQEQLHSLSDEEMDNNKNKVLVSKTEFRALKLLRNNFDFQTFVSPTINAMRENDSQKKEFSRIHFGEAWGMIRDGKSCLRKLSSDSSECESNISESNAKLCQLKSRRNNFLDKVLKNYEKFTGMSKVSFKSKVCKVLASIGSKASTDEQNAILQTLQEQVAAFSPQGVNINTPSTFGGNNDTKSLLSDLDRLQTQMQMDYEHSNKLAKDLKDCFDSVMQIRSAAIEINNHFNLTVSSLLNAQLDLQNHLNTVPWTSLAGFLFTQQSEGNLAKTQDFTELLQTSEPEYDVTPGVNIAEILSERVVMSFQKLNSALELHRSHLISELDYMEKISKVLVPMSEASSSSTLPSATTADFAAAICSTPVMPQSRRHF